MITVYISSVTLKKELHSQQNHIETVLRGKHVAYQLIDIASNPAYKDEMRARCGDETALAPQIFNGDFHCGDYKSFQQAVEEERILEYLRVS
ncbi:SH3 domain-binding glutamic acid-rich-like protein 3 [Pomacea canaliculata]|uniref:SH3 domain-binding glutamic acid-rich-like protein 3 n=1 Tax=Pomacea canaliculata TaxID=400727 RepID=UPI000D728934|nr:SH3 domain-binding glutamic acid-rich-like protein 3 [Pomacea canaliculata]